MAENVWGTNFPGSSPADHAVDLAAHSANNSGEWHSLKDHLQSVAAMTKDFAKPLGLGDDGYWTGLLHDLGKRDPEFQKYLRGERDSSPEGGHAIDGALVAKTAGLSAVCMAVLAHHTGLQNFATMTRRLRAGHVKAFDDPVDLSELHSGGVQAQGTAFLAVLPDRPVGGDRPRSIGGDLPARWLLSCLVDADRIDTEAHFDQHRAGQRQTAPTLDMAVDRFIGKRELASVRPTADPLNPLREKIRQQVVDGLAKAPIGVYTLTAPTGAGKTLTVLEAAFLHARAQGLRRVVMAAPFTSVVTQTADVLRALVGDDVLLEHHSNVVEPSGSEASIQGGPKISQRLAAENWDRPVIATTSVQLLETLFANRTTKLRKLHRLAKSVLIIDEVQSIPWDLLEPAVRMLAQVSEMFSVTVVLCTATPPPVALLPTYKEDKRDAPCELVGPVTGPRPDLDRVRTVYVGETEEDKTVSWEQLAGMVTRQTTADTPQALIVVNTIKDAITLHSLLAGTSGLSYLSTMLCPAHRRQRIAQVAPDLEAGRPLVLVSTQMIEAGVDLDFPVGFRAVAPLTSIVQTAGRINRHGARGEAKLFVFDPKNGSVPPGEYRIGTDITRNLLARGMDPLAPESVKEFYQAFGNQAGFADHHGINDARARLNFEDVSEQFRLITDDAVGVVVGFDGFQPMDLQVAPDARPETIRRRVREARDYTVNLRHTAFERACNDGTAIPIPGLPLHAWVGNYNDDTGLQLLDQDRSLHL